MEVNYGNFTFWEWFLKVIQRIRFFFELKLCILDGFVQLPLIFWVNLEADHFLYRLLRNLSFKLWDPSIKKKNLTVILIFLILEFLCNVIHVLLFCINELLS